MAMIQVSVRSTGYANTVVIDNSTTIRQLLEQEQIDYSRGMTTIDGANIPAGGLDKTFAEFGIVTKCFVANIVKADNAFLAGLRKFLR